MDTNNPAIPEIMLPDCAEKSETTETSVTKEKVSANSVMGHAEAAVFDLPTNSDCILRSVGDAGLKHELHDKEYSYSSDPVDWEITAHLRSYYAEHLPSQNLESDFTLKGRQFGDKIR